MRIVSKLYLSKAKEHIGHSITIATYGDGDEPDNIALECETCNEVLQDWDTLEGEED